MAPVQYVSCGRLLGLMFVSLIAGAAAILQILISLVRVGPRKFFHKKPRESRPEVLDDPELGTHHYARLKNIRLHYVSKGQEGRPLLLLLHGFPEIWYSWRYQLKEFANDFRVVAVDMRGYGESEHPEGVAEYHVDKLTKDVQELIEHLGYKKCYLAGHDWGASIAWSFAGQYPDMVQKLVICNAPHGAAFIKYFQSHWSQMLKSWYMFFFQLPYLPEFVMGSNDFAGMKTIFKRDIKARNITDDDMEAFLYSLRYFGDRTGPINYYRAAFRFQHMPPKKVKCPTMIIWGTGDAYLEREMVELSKPYVDNECMACYIEGASHWVQQDEPELVNKYMRDFLAGK